ncbi:hypothetical protein HXY32_07485 [Candidatus Bathyarchaeota archaeon]|nr:hypothetical protein [Candidatus Bathyarchaeota archaeon]
MKIKTLLGILLIACLSTTLVITPTSADTLLRTDFAKESFYKIVDYFEYARTWAVLHGLPNVTDYWKAYTYVTYVNKMGLQMLYAGLCNISAADQVFLTIPLQTILMHYKTEDSKRDALVGSSFLMLMGFNDTVKSIYPDSPDRNDTLWASFSLGLNLQNVTLPALNSKSEIFPLTSSNDGLTWKWGMRYTNLTAFWITTFVTEENETDTARPWGFATYDELTFNYTLTINPDTHKATISQDHAIGRIRDLWTFWGWFLFWPKYNYYNNTGCYRYGTKISNETVYDFLYKHNVKMSIVEFQTSIIADTGTYSTSANGQNVTDTDVFVGKSSISTYADDGEKIFDTAFGVKETYNLFNYTEDPSESTPHTYDAVVRTTEITGYAKNDNLFNIHRNFARYLPLILIHMYPGLYQKAKETITNMTRADYLFLISYPTYSGYRIEHDPLYTVYFAPVTSTVPNFGGLILIVAVAGAAIAALAFVLRKRGRKAVQTFPEQPPSPPTV